MSFNIDLFYNYEQKMKDATRRNALDEVETIRTEFYQAFPMSFPNADIVTNVLNSYFSEELFDLFVNHGFCNNGLKEINLNFVEKNKKYLEELWNISLKNVDVFFLDADFRAAEGWASPCKESEHYIVLPSNLETSFLSDDLIIHELGHTVEFYFRRQDINEHRIISHKILSEAIAHYGQFKYLSTQSFEKRISVLGSILHIAPLLEIIKYCHDMHSSEWEIDEVVNSDYFKILRKFYSIEKLKFLIEPYQKQSVIELYYYHVEPRLGAVLALSLLDNQEVIRSLCFAEKNKSVKDILDDLGLSSDQLLDFRNADTLLKKFLYQN